MSPTIQTMKAEQKHISLVADQAKLPGESIGDIPKAEVNTAFNTSSEPVGVNTSIASHQSSSKSHFNAEAYVQQYLKLIEDPLLPQVNYVNNAEKWKELRFQLECLNREAWCKENQKALNALKEWINDDVDKNLNLSKGMVVSRDFATSIKGHAFLVLLSGADGSLNEVESGYAGVRPYPEDYQLNDSDRARSLRFLISHEVSHLRTSTVSAQTFGNLKDPAARLEPSYGWRISGQ